MSEPNTGEELQKLNEVEETLAKVKGKRYAACVGMTLRSLLFQELMTEGTKDKMILTMAGETANDTLILGLLASGVTDSQAARKEFTDNLTMMAKSMHQVFRSLHT